MIIETNKTEYKWLKEFLNNYLELRKSHVRNGHRITDKIEDNLNEIVNLIPEKNGKYFVPIVDADFILELLECDLMSCPFCSVSSVKCRKAIALKMIKLIDEVV